MGLPQRVFYPVHEAAARWGCMISDIAGWAAMNKIKIVTGIPPVACGDAQVAGLVRIEPADIRGYPHLVATTEPDNNGMIAVMRTLDGDLASKHGEIRMILPAHRPVGAGRAIDLAHRTLKTGTQRTARQMERCTENLERASAA